MKRWLVILLVVAALVVLVSPGIVGRLAERNMQQNIDWADAESPQVSIQTESFERGWFSSEGRHRVTLNSVAGADEMPSLIIETRFDHGLIPFTSISREGGSLEPGLARATSTFQIETGDGELIDLPGSALSQIGLNGETDVHYVLPQGSREIDKQRFEWSGADIVVRFDPNNRASSISGEIQPITMTSVDGSATIGAISLVGTERITDFGFAVGSGELKVGAVQFNAIDGPSRGFESMSLQGETILEQDLVNGSYRLSVSGLMAPMLGEVAAEVTFSVSDLDAASVGRISQIVDGAKGSGHPANAMMEVFPLIEKDLQTLLAAGGSMNLDQLDITLPQGAIKSVLKLKFDKSDPDADFSWPAVALLTTASADISVPSMLIDMVTMMNPEAEQLVSMGLLKANGDVYEMQAEYAQGLMTINGAPFPIPLPGF